MAKAKPTPPKAVEPQAVAAAPYTVVARRYRPRQLADLIGQEHVASALKNAIESGRLAHAYLFTGARGVGKTSTARILAKCLNCTRGPTATPCDTCDICLAIANGTDTDTIEIDGASNNKVEEARELRNNVGFRPARAKFKIYIIDEVHMLSTGAFNALLKTMEEPPAHVKFILATTEVQKIPITILSRCQRLNFNTVGPGKILETLIHIAKKEGIGADADALKIVAKRANGSMRDSQTLLEQLLGACDGHLTVTQVNALFGSASDEQVQRLAGAILAADAKLALQIIGDAANAGLQLGELLDQLTEFWRGLMLASVSTDAELGLPEAVTAAAKLTHLDATLAGLDILAATRAKFRGSTQTQLLLEVAAVRLARLGDLLSVAELAQQLSGATAAPSHHGRPLVMPAADKKKLPATPLSPTPLNATTATPQNFDDIATLWPAVLPQLGHFLPAYLKKMNGPPAITGPNTLALRYAAAYHAEYDLVRGERQLEVLRKGLRAVTGAEWRVSVELDAAVQVIPNAASSTTSAQIPSAKLTRQALLGLPLFVSASKYLGAQLMRWDEGFDPTEKSEKSIAAVDVIEVMHDPEEPTGGVILDGEEG